MSVANGWIWAIGRLLGLSTTVGVRMWMTLFLVSLLSREGWGFHLPARFEWLASTPSLLILLVLTIFEIASDKVPSFDRLSDRLATPLRLAVGALVGVCALGHGWVGLAIGVPAGAAAAWLGMHARRLWRPRSTPSANVMPLLSLAEDLGAAAAALLSATLPPVGYAVFGWMAWFYSRLRGRRSAKYRGLRDGGEVVVDMSARDDEGGPEKRRRGRERRGGGGRLTDD